MRTVDYSIIDDCIKYSTARTILQYNVLRSSTVALVIGGHHNY